MLLLDKLKSMVSDEHPLVIEDGLVLWDGDLDNALRKLGMELEEDGLPTPNGEIIPLRSLGRVTRYVTVHIKVDNNEENQYVDFALTRYKK